MAMNATENLIDELECFQGEEPDNIRKVEMAQAALRYVIELLEEVVEDTDDGNADAYIVDHLKIMASEDHGFLSRDLNLDQWIERLRNHEDEDTDNDEDGKD
jgi:hypothetical protein